MPARPPSIPDPALNARLRGGDSAQAWARQIHAPAKIAAVVAACMDLGLASQHVLAGTGLRELDLQDPDTLTSTAQLHQVLCQAAAIAPVPDVGLRVGSRLRVTSYGMYGYALMCAGRLRDVLDLATRYQLLANPLVPIRFAETDTQFIWILPRRDEMQQPDLDARTYRVFVEMQMGIYMRLGRDVMGPDCVPTEAHLAWSPVGADDGQSYGCPVRFDADTPLLHYPIHWMEGAPQLADALTAARASRECAKLLAHFEPHTPAVAQRVYEELMRTPGLFPGIDDIASRLHMTSRTLRRHLQAQGSSYAELLTSVRRALAEDYLRGTRMSIEDIAAALDFSDARSFRHAFVRWTGHPPREFRRGTLQ